MTVEPRTADDVCVEVGEWLAGKFTGRFSPAAVHQVVRAAARDLEGQIVPEALGEMLHRLARCRLSRLSDATSGIRTGIPAASSFTVRPRQVSARSAPIGG
ncbi:hypothetical protein [Amycolatopsis jejuensis]|uniref:hypothetical protein n=1 Tax=Amycolatopsis jejuensis TaxID=330084 RepID=UPI000524BF4A|nr:hypothetical protein [Amycolatopsis jejuensis]